MESSEIIRAEIMRILNENGRTNGTELAKRAIRKVGNEKTVYAEISAMVESGQIEKRVYNKSHIEYEIINYDKLASEQLEEIYNDVDLLFRAIRDFEIDEKGSFYDRLRYAIHLIYAIEDNNATMRILSFYPTFRSDKMFNQVTRRIDDCWHEIMEVISSQDERDFIDSVFDRLQSRPTSEININ